MRRPESAEDRFLCRCRDLVCGALVLDPLWMPRPLAVTGVPLSTRPALFPRQILRKLFPFFETTSRHGQRRRGRGGRVADPATSYPNCESESEESSFFAFQEGRLRFFYFSPRRIKEAAHSKHFVRQGHRHQATLSQGTDGISLTSRTRCSVHLTLVRIGHDTYQFSQGHTCMVSSRATDEELT